MSSTRPANHHRALAANEGQVSHAIEYSSGTAPADPSPPPSYVTVTRRHAVTCGVLRPASTGSLRLTVQGSPDPVTIPLSQIASLAPAASCP